MEVNSSFSGTEHTVKQASLVSKRQPGPIPQRCTSDHHHLIAFTCAVINALPLEDIWTWQVLLTPSCGLEEEAKPLPVQSILRCKCNVFNAIRKRPNSSSHYLTGFFFFAPFKDRQTEEGEGGRRSWDGERTSEQVLFLWFFFIQRRRGENFSPLVTRKTTWTSERCVCVFVWVCMRS